MNSIPLSDKIIDNATSGKYNLTSYKMCEILNIHFGGCTAGGVSELREAGQLRRKLARLMLLVVCVSVGALLGCPIYNVFGVSCPCCGVTRAWVAFFMGQLETALQWHALFWLIPPVGVLFVVHDSLPARVKGYADVALIVSAVCIFAYAMLRWFGVVNMPC